MKDNRKFGEYLPVWAEFWHAVAKNTGKLNSCGSMAGGAIITGRKEAGL